MATATIPPPAFHPEHLLRAQESVHQSAPLLAPAPQVLRISEWAEKNRHLPKGASARPGPWVTESYQREIMDCILDHELRRLVLRTSTQVGKSEVINNCVGYYIDADPKPLMLVQPTSDTAKDYSNERITPMIASSPALKAKVREATSRRAGNTVRMKRFPGGYLKITGANSAAGLRSHPIATLLLDEVEAYPVDVDKEGDPIEIAERRTETFYDAKVILASTPARPRGHCRIDAEYEASSQALYYVPCPHCDFEQPLWWRDPDNPKLYRLRFERDAGGKPIAESIHYLCAGCGSKIREKFKLRMLAAGRWIHKYPERRAVRGYHLNALYSPWKPIWYDLACRWLDAQGDSEKLRAFVNLSLGESYEEAGEKVEAPELRARLETYAAPVPRAACVLVASADVQHNRIEAQVKGFGPGGKSADGKSELAEESWLIAHETFWGNPGISGPDAGGVDVWADLDKFLLRQWQHECGAMLTPRLCLVDSGAHADNVYNFVLPRQHARRIYACKGVEFLSQPGLAKETTTKRAKIRLWLVATYAAKDRVYARLRIPKPGAGYMHLPAEVSDEYLEQLTSEKKIAVRHKQRHTVRHVYIQTYGRNEALDLEVYCHAGLWLLQNLIDPATYRDLGPLAAELAQGRAPATLFQPRTRRVRSKGIQ